MVALVCVCVCLTSVCVCVQSKPHDLVYTEFDFTVHTAFRWTR